MFSSALTIALGIILVPIILFVGFWVIMGIIHALVGALEAVNVLDSRLNTEMEALKKKYIPIGKTFSNLSLWHYGIIIFFITSTVLYILAIRSLTPEKL